MIIAARATPRGKVNVIALNDVTFTCEPIALSGGPDEYSWHRVDGDIPPRSSGQNSSILTIHRITPADEGEYYCMATKFGHCAKSNNITVIVKGKKTTVPCMNTHLTTVNFNIRHDLFMLHNSPNITLNNFIIIKITNLHL